MEEQEGVEERVIKQKGKKKEWNVSSSGQRSLVAVWS